MFSALRHQPLLVLAMSSMGLSIALHGLTLLALGPWSTHWPAMAAWPAGFHLWLAETVCLVAGSAALMLHATRRHWQPWWASMPGASRARTLVLALLVVQAALLTGFWLTRHQGVDQLGGLRALFWLGGEFRLHALFCVLQAFLAAYLAARVYRLEQRKVWLATACICAYIGLDELLSIHEAVGDGLRASGWIALDTARTVSLGSGLHVYVWQLVFGPVALGVGVWLLRAFWAVLDPVSLALLVLSAVLFVGGALGLEALQATGSVQQADWSGSDAQHLNLLLEEALEAGGMTLAVYVFAWSAWRKTDHRQERVGTRQGFTLG